MTKSKSEIKVLAFKEAHLREGGKGLHKGPILKEKTDNTKPGNNTPEEVRSAQRNLLAWGFDTGDVQIGPGSRGYFVLSDLMVQLIDMITPNTAYMTGPPSMGSMKSLGAPSRLSDSTHRNYQGFET